ncbi:LAFA_0C09626g1_1 [Lachancea sp. 'fantastica']|nr:LAFA_0C09626g1_1 [Lachancea sp. 'fantastica']
MQRNRGPVRSLQAFTAKIIGGDKLVQRLDRAPLRSSAPVRLSPTDIWLREALVTGRRLRSSGQYQKKNLSSKYQAELSLNVVLNRLRNLRLTKGNEAYFTLLNRLQSNQIRWISKSGSYIAEQTPVELYRELSYMLRARASDSNHRADIICLAKFTLALVQKYAIILKTRASLTPDLVFWQNCVNVVARTGSVHYLQRILALADSDLPNSFAYIAFYLQTNQIPHLSSVLRAIRPAELHSLPQGLVLSSIDKFLCLGLDDDAEYALNILIKQDPLNDSTVFCLNHLAERCGALKIQLQLNKMLEIQETDVPVPWKTFQRDLTFKNYIELLAEARVQFFEERLPMDFLSTKLPSDPISVTQWCNLFQHTMPAENAHPSLKAFHFNTILTHVASHRSFNFVVLLWHRLIMEYGCTKAFTNSNKLANHNGKNGIHILLRAAGKSSAAKLAGYELFCYMKSSNYYNLTEQDYANLMLSTLHGGDLKTVYIYLRHYILEFGKERLTTSKDGDRTWNLGSPVETVIKKLRSMAGGAAEIDEVLRRVADWHVGHHSAVDVEISDKILKKIFGDLFMDHLSPKRILSSEGKWRKEKVNSEASPRHYSLLADWENVERVRLTLDYMQSQNI